MRFYVLHQSRAYAVSLMPALNRQEMNDAAPVGVASTVVAATNSPTSLAEAVCSVKGEARCSYEPELRLECERDVAVL